MIIKTYLVLGGNGFIGRNVVRRLSMDNKVIVADINNSEEISYNSNVTFMNLDFVNTKDFKPYLNEVDTVIHLISTVLPQEGIDNINNEIKENIFPTIDLLNDMCELGKKDIIFMSSGGTIYGNSDNELIYEDTNKMPICKYAVQKLTIEYYLNLYKLYKGINYKIIRAANPYSCEVKCNKLQGLIPILINKIINGEKITIWGDGENIRDYIYIDDLVDAFMAVDNYSGKENIFNVGTGIGHSINEILKILEDDLKDYFIDIFYEKDRACDVRNNVLDISLIKRCTGWSPKVSVKDGIKLSIDSRLREND